MNTSNIKTSIIATVETADERDQLFAAIYARYAMWEKSFIIGSDGTIRANPAWWRPANLWKILVWIEIHAYCKGWLDARKSFKSQLCQATG